MAGLAFSGIVAGNDKEEGIQAIEQFGPYELTGESAIMTALDALLRSFVNSPRLPAPRHVRRDCAAPLAACRCA